jgi:AMMECR1 domain-containing protein
LAEPEAFLRQLKRKAGLEEDFWSAELSVRRYTTRTWSDEPPVA